MSSSQKSHKRKRSEAASLFGYTDENNPFNDPKLTTPFRDWESVDKSSQVEELHELKKRRIQRQIEQKHLIEMRLAREREELARLWGDSDDHFEWKQIMLKSEIRINEKRAKLIDYIIDHSKLLHHSHQNSSTTTTQHSDTTLSHTPPEQPRFDALAQPDLEEFLRELDHCLAIEHLPFKELWESLHTLAKHQLAKHTNTAHSAFTHTLIQQQIDELFQGKEYDDLVKTEQEIREQLTEPDADVEYWDSLLRHMHIYKAQALLTHYYRDMMREYKIQKDLLAAQNTVKTEDEDQTNTHDSANDFTGDKKINPHDLVMQQSNQGSTMDFSKEVALPDTYGAQADANADSNQHDASTDAQLPRLVKPQYYNRVILGFEWSKYNRIHFDTDNLPPKQIQGYRFNLFFPLLPEGAPSPTYTVEKHTKGFCIVRFHAGPPYSDIAFQIIDKGEWETKPRKGFRCEFHSGILSLWFKFKRHTRRRKKGR